MRRPSGRRVEVFLIVILILAISIGHYATPPDRPLLHDLYRRLYYVPIVWASIRFGLGGGLVASVAASCVFLPHIFHRWGTIELQTTDAIFEILLYNAVAWVTGALVNSERRSRDSLEQAEIELVRADQMKQLGEIAAGMAHEVRNPLASLRGGIELISKESTSPENRAEIADILVPEVERIERVIKDFLLYARPAEPKLEELDVADVARDARELLENSMPPGVTLEVAVAPGTPRVMADLLQLRSVIVNLVLNAVSAVGDTGHVVISVEKDGGDVVLRVTDDGPGIPADVAERLFEPFFTTRKDGHGLGLSLVRRIVDAHGGDIGFASEPGGGTTFEVHLKGIRK